MRARDGGAGASAWARYRLLSGEYRHERIVLRLLLTVAAGTVVAGFIEVPAGVAAGVILFCAHTIYVRNRPGPVTSWRLGAQAERRTGRRLATLERGAYRVLHDRALPDAPATNLDHLVVGITGVYAVGSRRWSPGVRLWADHRRVWAGGSSLASLHAATARAARTVSEALGVEVVAVVAVHGARLPRAGLRFGEVEYQRVRALAGFIRDHPVVFTSAQVETITAAAEELLPPMQEPYRFGETGR